jgi:hypothetical protein
MAAGLGFKTFNTGDVLSASDTNGYLMQGIWVFANATARDAAVTSPQEGNSCYLKDTDVIQVYSGSSWVVKSGGSSPLTTKGDVYTYSTTDTRLGVGANDTVLTADSSTATGLKWAAPAGGGGMTLLSTTTLSGATTTISVASGYNYITGVVTGVTNNTANGRVYIAPNGVTNLSSATGTARYSTGAASVRVEGYDNSYLDLTRGYDTLRTSADNAWYFTIYNYTSSTRYKPFSYGGTYIDNDSASDVVNFQGAFRSNTAITTLDFSQSGGNFTAGTVLLYGVK